MARILIVDDEAVYREVLRAFLESGSHQVVEVGDGQEALKAMAASIPDLVVLDSRMPELDGFGVLQRMRREPRLADIPVLLVSVVEESAEKVRGLDLGANDYMTKPIDRSELLARVRVQLRMVPRPAATERAAPFSDTPTRPAPPPCMSPTNAPQQHFMLDRRYLLGPVLATGGTGIVYEATDVQVGRSVAIKVLSRAKRGEAQHARRLAREACIAASLEHPDICRVFDLGQLADGSPYVVMERLVGESLAARLRTIGPLPFDSSLAILTHVLSGLDFAHSRNVLHRDVKPDNIFLATDGSGAPMVKLLDFGLAKLAEPSCHSTQGQLPGTPAYMAPELMTGSPASVHSDLYACGVALYEMICGRRPFPSDDLRVLRETILEARPAALQSIRPQTPSIVVDLVARAMAREPAARYESARLFLQAVSRAQTTLDEQTSPLSSLFTAPVSDARTKRAG